MKIRSITFTQRFNMGNYEHIEITAMADIEEQEAADTAMQSLKTFVQTALNKKVEEKTAPAPVEEVKPEPVVEEPKKEKKAKAKKEKVVEEVKEEVAAPVAKNVVVYNSNLAEHKSIFGGYLAKKYDNAWKTAKPVEEIKAFTASLNGKHFLDNDGKIVDSFLELVHGFFGA